jgi:hypothetical protein
MLSAEPQLYQPVASLTGIYERVWYGQARATAADYTGFVERYAEAVR